MTTTKGKGKENEGRPQSNEIVGSLDTNRKFEDADSPLDSLLKTSEEIARMCNSIQNIAGQIDKKQWLPLSLLHLLIDELDSKIEDATYYHYSGKKFKNQSFHIVSVKELKERLNLK